MEHPAGTARRRPRNGSVKRKDSILLAATLEFSLYGFRGASLRDIASEAGVSLTLLDHHFGTKADLLRAVVEHHHAVCREAVVKLRARVIGSGQPVSLRELGEQWVAYEFEEYASQAGGRYLGLLAKLAHEEEIDESTRLMLDCTHPVIDHALTLAAPDASEAARLCAYRLASTGLRAEIRSFGSTPGNDEAAARLDAADFCTRFIVAGLEAELQSPAKPVVN